MFAELKAARSDATLIHTISNPGAKTALHPDMYAAVIESFANAERDDSVRVIVLTGADGFFCASGNLNRLLENRHRDMDVQAAAIDNLQGWIEAIRNCPKPVIAAVEGAAAGAGFSLALACDLVIAGMAAKFMMSYVKVGLTPDGGASWFLGQALPRQLAGEILLEGKAVLAARLQQLGLVNRIVTDGRVIDAALTWADELATLSPNSLNRIKMLIDAAPANSLAQQCELEKRHFIQSMQHRDSQEGITAFLEKRKPQYK